MDISELIKEGYEVHFIIKMKDICKNPRSEIEGQFYKQNEKKTCIELIKKTGERKRIFTNDVDEIKEFSNIKEIQDKPISYQLKVLCAAINGSDSNTKIHHLDRVIVNLQGIQDWTFEISKDDEEFIITIPFDTIDQFSGLLMKVEDFLSTLALISKIGFIIKNTSIIHLTDSFQPKHGMWGPQEYMMPPLSSMEIEKINRNLTFMDENSRKILNAINKAYIENNLISRLSILWSVLESIFRGSATHLLTKKEIKAILNLKDKELEGLKSNTSRYEMFKNCICQSKNFPNETRNQRIARNISKTLSLPEKEIYDKIKWISKLRGKNVHDFRLDDPDLKRAEDYLIFIFMKYLELKD